MKRIAINVELSDEECSVIEKASGSSLSDFIATAVKNFLSEVSNHQPTEKVSD
jgi:metal-responsive CopG/Arc/MetJ family transcriptional regulator